MNHLSRTFLLLALLVHSLSGQAQSGDMSLSQAIAYAQTNHPDLLDAQLKIRDAEEVIKQSIATGLPQLSAGGTYQYYFKVPVVPLPAAFTGGEPQNVSFVLKNNLTGSVNLDAMVFDAAYFVGLRAARAARNFAQLELNDRQRQVRGQVRNAYLPLLLLKSNLDQLDKNIASLTNLFQETQEIYRAGFAEQLDVDRLELSLANLTTERENLARQYEMALQALKFTLNYPADQDLNVADDLDGLLQATSVDALVAPIDYSRRTEITLLNEALGLNELNVKVNKTRFIPTLRAFGGYQYQYQGNSFSNGFWAPTGFVGLSVNIPLYDGGLKRALVERAQIATEQVAIQQTTLRRLVQLEVTNARTGFLNAQNRLAERDRNLALANRIYNTTQVKYREGVGSSLEVNQAEQDLYNAQTNRLQALYELLQAKMSLEEALGWQ
jgi:outer membrane protein